MQNLDRRRLLHASMAVAIPWAGMSLLCGCQPAAEQVNNDGTPDAGETDSSVDQSNSKRNEKHMHVHYLEIVTPEVDVLCKQYSTLHGMTFGEPEASLGNARLAKMEGGGMLAIRAPMRPDEAPVIRPYVLVEDIEASVAAAADVGAEVALPPMELPGHGTCAIVIQGGIECGFWQN